jgi:hypothetical protein
MKHRLSKIALSTILALTAVAGLAANSNNISGLYLGLGGGYGAIETGSSTTTNPLFVPINFTSKMGGFAGRINGGYFSALNDNFALGVDLAYTMYPNSQIDGTIEEYYPGVVWNIAKVTASSIDLTAVVKYFIPFVPALSISGRAGMSAVNQTYDQTTEFNGIAFSKSATTYRPLLGVGLGYAIGAIPGLTVTADYQYIFGSATAASQIRTAFPDNHDEGYNNSVYAVLFGINYNFGALS